jgi:PKD repeat protein
MTGAARRRQLRALAAGSAALVLAVGLALVTSVAGGVQHAAANPQGASPTVYVVGTGGADRFTLSSVSPTAIGNVEPGTTLGPVAVNSTATKALIGVAPIPGTPGGPHLDLVAGNTVTGSSVQLRGSVIGIAMDPSNPNLAYALVRAGEIYRVDISGPTPVPTVLTVEEESSSLAIAPNGQTLYAGFGNGDGTCGLDAIPINPPNTPTTIYNCPRNEGRDVVDVAVSPNGSQIFAAVQLFSTSVVVALGAQPWTQPLAGEEPTTLTVGPGANTVYVGMFNLASRGSTIQARRGGDGALLGSTAIPILSNGNQQGGVSGIAVSPDGATMIAAGSTSNATTGAAQTVVVPVSLQLPLTAGLATAIPGLSTTGPQNVAITPDQAPVASFSSLPAVQAGHAITFDASPSTVAYGSVNHFGWTFGDGGIATTSGPTVSHTYAAPGSYTVTLTETDSAGTSVPPAVPGTGFAVDGPGQTAYRLAGPSAQARVTVRVTTLPPPTSTPTTTHTTTTTHTGTTTTTTAPSTTTTTKPGQPKPGTPTLILNPGLGPPGTIVTVTGTGFTPNTAVTVAWSVSSGSVVITADAHGDLPPTLLVLLTPDVLGPRFAEASSTPQATAPFLVVPGSDEPGGDNASLLFRSEDD